MKTEFYSTIDFYKNYKKEYNILDYNPLFALIQFFTGLLLLVCGIWMFVCSYSIINSDTPLLRQTFIWFKLNGIHYGILFYLVVNVCTLVGTYKSIYIFNRLFLSRTDNSESDIGKTWSDTLFRNSSILILSQAGVLLIFMT